ncbi:hypothetical protein E1265_20045 [Streptomyces sp. 8K308]|uniref:WXG100 family type VII secretion target n=1 Tax=Streptomyces sp. 8K308 TaxID=2530388 RepID=UPI00104CB881|nr:hypothetical protein [Streptomyces sp. 8K308]TDC20855.1 hypothetical protein E1265_20045 [Streptomyces sp. 8K308]
MSDPNLLYSSDPVERLKGNLDAVISELGSVRSRVSGASADTQAGWSGDAARELVRGAGEMDAVLGRMIPALENLRELVQMSGQGFTAEEQEQAAQMRAATAGLNQGIAGR